jgi:DNA-binding NtrC family response regulator
LEGDGRMKGRICIVDHDLTSRGYLRECLEKEGHDVSLLENGSEVRPCLSQGNFDIIILNVETPGVKERDFLLDIKKTSRPRVLLIVSERGDIFLREAIQSGVYGFIHKPFKIDEVCTMVNHLTR